MKKFAYFMKPTKKYSVIYHMLYGLIFSMLGLFLYTLQDQYVPQDVVISLKVKSVYSCLAMMLFFNLMGFLLLKISSGISKDALRLHHSRRKLLIRYILTLAFLLAFNYLCLIVIKWINSSDTSFLLSPIGITMLQTIWFIETFIVSLLFVEYSTRHAIELHKEKQSLVENAELAQYHALQSQMNPHFLFNNLSVLTAEIENDPRAAVVFVAKLSNIYRYILQQQDKMYTSLREELNFFDSYIFLYQTRFGTKLRIQNNIPESLYDACVPPLTLQLLAENVFKHNYMTEESPVTISLDVHNHNTRLSMTNTLQPRRDVPSSGRGLDNLSKRLQILCGRPIEIHRTDDHFTVTIPLFHE